MMSASDLIESPDEVHWQVWYQDTFDRECPRQIDLAGQGLLKGLIELWARHLSESVHPGGFRGFSRFNLWITDVNLSIVIEGERDGLVRLREWMQIGGRSFLKEVSRVHAKLIQKGRNCEQICSAARDARRRLDFEQWLADFE